MPKPIARTTSLFMLVLIILVGTTSQSVWANESEDVAAEREAMMRECQAAGAMDCLRECRTITRIGIGPCREAFKQFKKGQSDPAPAAATIEQAPSKAKPPNAASTSVGVEKVTVMGVRLCSDVVEAGGYLEGQGFKNAAVFAKSLRRITVSKREGNDNFNFNINNGGSQKRDAIYLMSFHGGLKDDPNLFESEKSKFEQATGIELTCTRGRTGPNETRLECKYPAGEADRSQPGFSYTIAHEEGQQSFFIDAAAWGFEDCGL